MTAPAGPLTPYALVFGGERFEREVFPAIEAEVAERGVDSTSPEAFLLLAAVGELLRELPAGAAPDAQSALVAFGALLFQAFHFRRFGRRGFLLTERGLDSVLTGDMVPPDWTIVPPHPAGYLKLPRHRVWSRVHDDAPAEPVDGFFWTMIAAEGGAAPPHPRLDVLLALGVRSDRPGLSVIPAATALGTAPPEWLHQPARAGEEDFANVLPGGELRGFHALVNAAEALKLVARVFWLATSADHRDEVRPLDEAHG